MQTIFFALSFSVRYDCVLSPISVAFPIHIRSVCLSIAGGESEAI